MNFDIEPEDAWDPGDRVEELVDNLIRRAELLTGSRTIIPISDGLAATLEELAHVVQLERARRVLSDRDVLRADQIDEDIEFLRGRI